MHIARPSLQRSMLLARSCDVLTHVRRPCGALATHSCVQWRPHLLTQQHSTSSSTSSNKQQHRSFPAQRLPMLKTAF
eukprot:7793453-Alexandrium_andersonii.AAC.1